VPNMSYSAASIHRIADKACSRKPPIALVLVGYPPDRGYAPKRAIVKVSLLIVTFLLSPCYTGEVYKQSVVVPGVLNGVNG
jgi:hypothetical protein